MAHPSSSKSKGKVGTKRPPTRKALRASAASCSLELFNDDPEDGFADQSSRASESSIAHIAEDSSGLAKQLVKLGLGVLLLPVAFILTGGFLGIIKQSALFIQQSVQISALPGHSKPWALFFQQSVHQGGLLDKNPLLYLTAGMILFAVMFAAVPRGIFMLPYIFGHEVTHALCVKLFGGNVANRFHVSLEGGHVLTDRVNTWIVLSPYFFPIYAVLVGTLYGVLLLSGKLLDTISHSSVQRSSLYESIIHFQWLFLLLIGFALAFHLIFTFLLVTRSQPDLHYGGTFFSLMMIYMINLLLVTVLLLTTSSHWLVGYYGDYLMKSAELFIEICGQLWIWGAEGVKALLAVCGK
jgi:hypothetical protein